MKQEVDFPKVYAVDVSGMDSIQFEKAVVLVSSYRKKKVQKLYRLEDKKRCIAAGILVEWLLKCVCGLSDEEAEIDLNGDGKPVLKNGKLHFSISHSGRWVVAAISDVPVGVDIEEIKNIKVGVFRQCMTDEEISLLMDKSPSERNKHFIRLWTLKESYTKMTGQGLYDSFKNFAVRRCHTQYLIERNNICENAQLKCLEFERKYYLSVCISAKANRKCTDNNIYISELDFEKIINSLSVRKELKKDVFGSEESCKKIQ